MNIKRILSILLSSSVVFGISAFAAHEIKSDPIKETIIINGSVDESVKIGAVSVNILKLGKTISELEELTYDIIAGQEDAGSLTDIIAYSIQVPVNSDNTFTVEAPIDGDSGLYTIFVDYEGNTDKEGVEFAFVKHDDNIAAIEKLINASSESEAVKIMDEEWIFLDFSDDLYDELEKDEVAKVYYNLFNEEPFEKDDIEKANLYFDRACILQGIEEGKCEIAKCCDILGIDSDNKLNKYATTDRESTSKAIIDNMKGVDCNNLEELEDELRKATVLAFIRYPDGNGEVKEIIKDFADEIGISNPSNLTSVYSKLAGNSYNDYEDIKSAYSKALKDNSNISSGGTGGSGGGSRGNSNSDNFSTVGVAGVEVDPIPVVDNTKKEQKFDDLDSVAWAKDSIMALYQLGIVSGKSENKFAPNDPLTREQFVTMLVNAFELEENDETASFDDVNPDDWFAKYVKIAAQNGIVKGVGTGFGTGKSITRQDMAVMVMNTIKKLNLNLVAINENVVFDDEADISDYAKESVEALNAAGIINGMGDGSFNPKGVNTRAQAAVVIYAVLKAVGK